MNNQNYTKRDDGVVINNNLEDYRRYQEIRERTIRERELKNKIQVLEQEIDSIKKALNKIYSRLE